MRRRKKTFPNDKTREIFFFLPSKPLTQPVFLMLSQMNENKRIKIYVVIGMFYDLIKQNAEIAYLPF